MELASLPAGEQWSDHPACTHSLLIALARDVNDYTSDSGRSRLARIALMCARMALPAAAPQQQVMAVSVLACERVLADLDGPARWLEEASRAVLAQVPQAAQWSCGLTRGVAISPKTFRRRSAPATVHTAVKGIAQACVPQPDEMFYDLLAAAIGGYAAWSGRDAHRSTRRNTAMVAIAA